MSQLNSSRAPVIPDNGLIEVVGYGPKPFSKVKDAVIYLGGSFYFRDDSENLVRVKDNSGKKKLFRKNSKLLIQLGNGTFIHRSNAVQTEDGIWLNKEDPSTVIVDGKYTRLEYCIDISGKLYLKTDPRLKICAVTKQYTTVENSIALSQKLYGEAYVDKACQRDTVTTKDGQIILKAHSRLILDADGTECLYHIQEIQTRNLLTVFRKFRDVTNPQLDRIEVINAFTSDKGHFVMVDEIGYYVHKNIVEEVKRIYTDVILIKAAEETAQLKALLKYADDGPDENQAKVVKKILQPWPGKHQIFNPKTPINIVCKKTTLTGGLPHTFGVEYETSQGLLDNNTAEAVKLKIVGDRSIGAAEYVTGILQGDDGIAYLEEQCKALARSTLVDDKCGLHVHIAGFDPTRHFAINAIKLGTQIEPELYASCPATRSPMLKHCHSIMRWKDINDENWREYLGAYAFADYEENWKSPWSFHRYKYGVEGRNKDSRVDTWCPARYKWLNLIHILTKGYNTCELRIFPGTTSFNKVYMYVLTSMAFAWFAENRINLIAKGNVTLSMMFSEAFKDSPELVERLTTFYKERTARFNRGTIYPSEIPKAIF